MKNILLVLGAGASADLGFPVGTRLLDEVIGHLDAGLAHQDSNDLVNKIYSTSDLWQESIEVGDKMRINQILKRLHSGLLNGKGRGETIDKILGELGKSEPISEKLGRYAIAYLLMGYETKALEEGKFYQRDFWLRNFWESYLNTRGTWENSREHLRIITFNYERSLEHSLAVSLWLRGVDVCKEEFIGQNFMKENIFHVYGKLGEYAPPLTKDVSDKVAFGSPNTVKESVNLRSDMFTLMYDHREKYPNRYFEQHFKWADRICFLGFGFDPDNMKRLGWENVNKARREVIGTYPQREEGEYLGISTKNFFCQEFWDKRCLQLD